MTVLIVLLDISSTMRSRVGPILVTVVSLRKGLDTRCVCRTEDALCYPIPIVECVPSVAVTIPENS